MRELRIPGILAYAAMAMWLLLTFAAPARAETGAAVAARVASRLAELKQALIAQGAAPDARITLSAPDAVIAVEDGDPLLLQTVSFNAATGRFLIRARGTPEGPLYAIAGSAVAPTLVPAPARAIARNEIIGEADIDWVEIADDRAGLYVDDADAIVGKIARRPLAAGAPLRKADLTAPILIRRGASATIILEAPGIRLTQIGVALSNGAEGDLIAFRNVNSDREIKAVVAAENLARAPFAARRALASAEME